MKETCLDERQNGTKIENCHKISFNFYFYLLFIVAIKGQQNG